MSRGSPGYARTFGSHYCCGRRTARRVSGIGGRHQCGSQVHTCATFPLAATDPVMRRVQAANPDVFLVDIRCDGPAPAMRALNAAEDYRLGLIRHWQLVPTANDRGCHAGGAGEFIERPTTTTDLLEAFVRFTAAQRKVQREGPRGRILLHHQCQRRQRGHDHRGKPAPWHCKQPMGIRP